MNTDTTDTADTANAADTDVREIVEPVFLAQEDTPSRAVWHALSRGQPVAVCLDDTWHLITPEEATGYPTTRRLIDLPLRPALLLEPETAAPAALEQLNRSSEEIGLVVQATQVLGVVTRERLLQVTVDQARQAAHIGQFLAESLDSSRTLAWRVQWPRPTTDLLTALPGVTVEAYGPIGKLSGYARAQLEANPRVWFDSMHPEDRALLPHKMAQLLNQDRLIWRYRFCHPAGHWLWLQSHVRLERDRNGDMVALCGLTTDVTDSVHAQMRERLVENIHRVLSERRPGETLESAFAILGEALPIDVVLVWSIEGENRVRVAIQWVRPEMEDAVKAMDAEISHEFEKRRSLGRSDRGSGVQDAIRRGESVYIADLGQSHHWVGEIARRRGMGSAYIVPLILGKERKSLLGLISRRVDAFDRPQRSLIQRLAPTFTAVVEAWNYETDLERLNAELEERVHRRTFELEVLYETAQRLGCVLDYDELAAQILAELHRVVRYDVAASLLVAEGVERLYIDRGRPLTPAVESRVIQRLLETYHTLGGPRLLPEDVDMRVHETARPPESPIVDRLGGMFQAPLIVGSQRELAGLLLVGSEEEEVYDGHQVRLIYTIAHQAALSLQRLRALMATEQQRLESLVDQLPEGVLLLNPEKRIVLANAVARRCLSVLSDATVGHVVSRLGDKPIAELLAPLPPGESFHTVEAAQQQFQVVTRSVNFGPQSDDRGWVLTLQDMTAEYARRQFLQTQERLATVGQMAAGIAHDFNNILAVIVLYSRLLQQNPDTSKRDQYLNTIHQQSMRASELVGQILDFSRRSVMERAPMDLTPFVKETVKLLQRTLPDHIAVELDYAAGEHLVDADPTRLEQVFMNLALNARDAMPQGGKLQIVLSRLNLAPDQRPPLPDMPSGDWIVVAVSDTGVGIPGEILPHIYEPFFTTKGPGQGTGLGLAQVYGIVQQHDGWIGVDSAEGKGTTFTVYLPALKTDRPAPPTPTETEESLPTARGEETILLVEDNAAAREAAQEILNILGYRVMEAVNGREGLALFEQHARTIDLVVSDLMMPEMGGLELYRALKERWPKVKFMVVTGYFPAELEKSSWEPGIVAWLRKPFSIEEIARTVRQALDG